MTTDSTDTLYKYYEREKTLPTFARFSSTEQLDKYERQRAEIFTEKLHLPTQLFREARLLEFGPDSGENSLVFARWGASLNLVEPNSDAHPRILNYFEQFNLKNQLEALFKQDLAHFKSDTAYQIIDAEGFIYTFRPETIWLALFKQLLDDRGFCIINYYESLGGFLELILKVIHARVKSLTGLASEESAWKLFQAKWESIPHTRSFKSWVMDVLENPFVRFYYFFDARDLCIKLSKYRFSVYSSWPNYIDRLHIYWHKKQLSAEEKLQRNLNFITRSCLSFAFGKKLFLTSSSQADVEAVHRALMDIAAGIDQSIDLFDPERIRECVSQLAKVRTMFLEDNVLADSEADKQAAIDLIVAIQQVFDLLITGDIPAIADFCNTNAVFIQNWGIPYHFLVFQKEPQ